MISVLHILILVKGRCWHLLGTELYVSCIMFPCSHNFSVGVHWCWLSQEATQKVQVTRMVLYFLYRLAHGLVWSCSAIFFSVVFSSYF